MDFYSWVSSEVSDGVDWLFTGKNFLKTADTAANVFGKSSSKTSDQVSEGILGRAIAKATNAKDAPEPGVMRSTKVSSGAPAKVVSSPLFKDKNDDAWMQQFRYLMRDQKGQIGLN